MNITASFQYFAVSALHVSVAARADSRPAPTTTAPSADGGADTVSLSTAATAAPSTSETDEATGEAPGSAPETGQPPSPLFAALDADEDGAVTKEEFTSGALSLLGKRGGQPRVHGNGDGENGRRARGVPGLERRLEKAFDRVDANDDGSLDQGEMSAALSGGEEPSTDVALPPAASETTPTGVTASFVSVTYVSVAIHRYTSLQASEPSSPSTSATDPSAGTASPVAAPVLA